MQNYQKTFVRNVSILIRNLIKTRKKGINFNLDFYINLNLNN